MKRRHRRNWYFPLESSGMFSMVTLRGRVILKRFKMKSRQQELRFGALK